ncbi:protein of unknown function [Pseudodesulfovibrio profundus]|uniref:Uncharacterized protein n=1 Tax=Pseudodesulfovibrio profundus TaxID=57320 RepID=A0A2C8FEK8_9BACT|nr:hypothetical protein [Pseudodesulfovibrio profundus]SOB60606.1 protein of unknown function [Pseudodesulfovibrio profundus]
MGRTPYYDGSTGEYFINGRWYNSLDDYEREANDHADRETMERKDNAEKR